MAASATTSIDVKTVRERLVASGEIAFLGIPEDAGKSPENFDHYIKLLRDCFRRI